MATHAVNSGRFFARLRTVWLLFSLVLFATTLAMVVPKTALAEGENFVWQGQDIAASGGVFATPQFSPPNVTFTKNGNVYTATQNAAFGGITCFGDYTITLTSGTSGSMHFKYRDCPGQGNETTIPNITITGTPPAGTPGGPAPTTGGVTGVAYIQDAQNTTAQPVYLKSFPIQLEGENHNAVVTTQGAGNFVFTNVPPGTYTIKAKGPYTDPAAGTFQIDMSKTGVIVTAGQTAGVSLTQTAALNPADTTDTCATQSGALGWLTCPVISWAAEAAESLSILIVNLLKLDTATLFNSNNDPTKQATSDAFHAAWAGFRNIAYAILVIIGLIMIASQIFNIEIFSAYTLRKMLPGIIIAIIFVTLSWDLMEFLYNMSNAAADAVMEIIKLPFQQVAELRDKDIGSILGGLIQLLLFGGAAAGVVVTYAAFGGPAVVLALVASIALSVFSVFILLAARNVVAYFLVIVAPVPIMMAAFEPLKKGYSFWKGLVIVILITVPGVAGILAVTSVGSAIAVAAARSQTSAGSAFISYISAFVILIAGVAMVWTLFLQMDKITGFLGNVANKVTGKAQQGLANFRGNTLKRRFGEVKSGERKLGMGLERLGVGTGVQMASLAGRPGQKLNPFKKEGREGWKGLKEAAYMQSADAARKLIERDRGRTTGGDDNMAIAQGAEDLPGYVRDYAERKKQQHIRRFGEDSWTAEREKEAVDEGWTTGRQIEASMGAIGSKALKQASYIARRTSATAYNDYDLRTDAGKQAMREEMALEDSRAIDAGLFNAVEIASINKENKARVDISGESYPRMMGHINEAYKRYKALAQGTKRGKVRVRKMDPETGKPVVDEQTGQTVYEDVDLGTIGTSAGAQVRLLSNEEHDAIARGVSEYTTAAAKMAGRTETIQVEAQYSYQRLGQTVEANQGAISEIQQELEPAQDAVKLTQERLTAARDSLALVINDSTVPVSERQAAQASFRAREQEAAVAQGRYVEVQKKRDSAQREVIRQLAAVSAQQQVMATYSTPENSRTYDEMMLSQTMPGTDMTVAAYIEQLRQTSDVFSEFERTYRQNLAASVQSELAQQTAGNPANPAGRPPGAPL